MKKTCWVIVVSCAIWCIGLPAAMGAPMGTAFTYQGQLKQNGAPYPGTSVNLQFSLWDAAGSGNPPAGGTLLGAQCVPGVPISGGLFTVTLNAAGEFGANAFNGEARWLQIGVSADAGCTSVTTLAPRQPVTPAPYALALPGLWTQDNATSPNLIGGYFGNIVANGVVGATIGGGGTAGMPNSVSAELGTVAGGVANEARADLGAVGGGAYNVAGGSRSTVGGGHNNRAFGVYSTIPGGMNNSTGSGADSSLAAGQRAAANHAGTFVWSDTTTVDPNYFTSTANNQFLINAVGGVGIGTNATDANSLTVKGVVRSMTGGFKFPDGTVQSTAATGGGGFWNSSGSDIYNNNSGKVGIGTSAPSASLHVRGNDVILEEYSGNPTFYARRANGSSTAPQAVLSGNVLGQLIGQGHDANTFASGAWISLNAAEDWGAGHGSEIRFVTTAVGSTTGNERMRITSAGNVGIGTSPDQQAQLHVVGSDYFGIRGDCSTNHGAGVHGWFTGNSTYGTGVYGRATSPSIGTGVYGEGTKAGVSGRGTGSGVNYGVYGSTASPDGYAGYFDGKVSVKVLEITGADVAEKFPATEQAGPGTVMQIDPDHPGQLKVARGACNKLVAGIVSGAHGLPTGAVLGHLPESQDGPAIALTGRVWTLCDASNESVQPGDLLTTSDTPGHAMKVTDHTRAQGAIIGKAMTGLEKQRGLVLVLVSLQ